MLVFAADLSSLEATHRQTLSRDLDIVPYVHAMFSTGHDAANRDVFVLRTQPNSIS
ncbi:hypothetical protein PPGU19_091950 (plasmid) [Paraburkholderia sp. PGU19]|nr:hypothetical protein PPGU19_091950 [Paraburkholderia sp. PGU19]